MDRLPGEEEGRGRVRRRLDQFGELRGQLSLSSLRASMACMLDQCHQIGDTAALCTRRREVACQVEQAMRQQRDSTKVE